MNLFALFLMLFLSPVPVFAAGQMPQDTGTFADGTSKQTLEGCFAAGGDPGSRSGCIMDVAANEKDVVLCDLIEIPGMVRDCINGVAAVTTITADKCRVMNENFRGHCMSMAKS